MIVVYHNSEYLQYLSNPSIESLKVGHFEKVADVETDDLEMAFDLTHDTRHPWHINTNVKAVRRFNRSSSIGDLLEKDKNFFVITSDGFYQLSPEEECEITFFVPAPVSLYNVDSKKCACKGTGLIPPKGTVPEGTNQVFCPQHRIKRTWPQAQKDGGVEFKEVTNKGLK